MRIMVLVKATKAPDTATMPGEAATPEPREQEARLRAETKDRR